MCSRRDSLLSFIREEYVIVLIYSKIEAYKTTAQPRLAAARRKILRLSKKFSSNPYLGSNPYSRTVNESANATRAQPKLKTARVVHQLASTIDGRKYRCLYELKDWSKEARKENWGDVRYVYLRPCT